MEGCDISVIIPCYNTQPAHLKEALDSIKSYSGKHTYEIIIIDDGSTNESTIEFLNTLNNAFAKVIHQPNAGASVARNNGVKISNGEYILFLDSDDRIRPWFIDKSISALSINPVNGVAYGKAFNFGDNSRGGIETEPFNITVLLMHNQVPMCTIIKKIVWESVNGLDENLKQFEDWEFWIRVYKAGWNFIYFNEIAFDYRIQNNSFFSQVNDAYYKKILAFIYAKHWDLVHKSYNNLYSKNLIYQNDMKRPFRSFFKYLKLKITGQSISHNS